MKNRDVFLEVKNSVGTLTGFSQGEDRDMDDSGHRDNGRHKSDHYKAVHSQWMMSQNQMKDNHTIKIMSLIAERDNAIHECNLALSEKKAALAERDVAILQRDAAIAERNSAIMERDSAIAALEYTRENAIDINGGTVFPSGSPALRGAAKHHSHQHVSHIHSPPQISDTPYNHARDIHITEAFPISSVPQDDVKPQCSKRSGRGTKVQTASSKKPSKSRKRKGTEDLNKQVTVARTNGEWNQEFNGNGDNVNKDASVKRHEWRGQELGLNQVTFDETMPVPGCSCTGTLHHCYKWGNGGWQSSCCTTTMSMYPLPVVPNKRHARVGGRKMSGSAFTKLLSRLAQEGHDLSMPVDLKEHWAKHGTNRYITVK